jgi:hypothetical protein
MGRPIRLLMTVLLLPLHPPGLEWGLDQNTWNAMHILGPPTADGEFREPLPPPGQPTDMQQALERFKCLASSWWENRWALSAGFGVRAD